MQRSKLEPDKGKCACGRRLKDASVYIYRSHTDRYLFHRCECGAEWTEHQTDIDPTDPVSSDQSLEISDTIQTDVIIDPGTAGGPLLNVGGQVVGVSMAAQASSQGFGLNTADIQDDVQQILTSGQLVVASLGATSTVLSLQAALLVGSPEGGRLAVVDKTGPAATAGLQPGDVVTQLDDVAVDAAHPLPMLLRSRFHPNQRVNVTYTRGTASTQVQLTLVGAHPTC